MGSLCVFLQDARKWVHGRLRTTRGKRCGKRNASDSLACQGSKLDGPELDYVQGHHALAVSRYDVGGLWKILQDVPYSADSGLMAVAIPATCFSVAELCRIHSSEDDDKSGREGWQSVLSVAAWTLAMAKPKVTVGFGAA